MTPDDFLRDKVYVSVPTLATATDFSTDYVELEIKRGNLELLGAGRTRRIPAESARKWLLRLQKRTAPVNTGRSATRKETTEREQHST